MQFWGFVADEVASPLFLFREENMAEYLDFKAISVAVRFKELLDYLNIPYEEKRNELKGHTEGFNFIVNIVKNLFFSPNSQHKGSVINFFSAVKNIPLREAAAELKREFLDTPTPCQKKVPDLTLEYHQFLSEQGIDEETARAWGVGYCKAGIMRGRITFAIHDKDGVKVAYCGLSLKDNKWLFPKGYKHEHIYGLYKNGKESAEVYVNPLDAIKNNGLALLTLNATVEQIELLGEIKKVLLFHPAGDNIGLRLFKKTFVKIG